MCRLWSSLCSQTAPNPYITKYPQPNSLSTQAKPRNWVRFAKKPADGRPKLPGLPLCHRAVPGSLLIHSPTIGNQKRNPEIGFVLQKKPKPPRCTKSPEPSTAGVVVDDLPARRSPPKDQGKAAGRVAPAGG